MSTIFNSIPVNEETKRFVDHAFDVADQIYAILEKQGKTQRDLASLLGKKESEISKWMQGAHNFTIKSISKIEAVLGESVITTPLKARTQFSSTKMVPIKVYSNTQRMTTIPSNVILSDKVWDKSSESSVFNNGLKSA